MKILGGKYKGRNFFMPAGIRPTQNILRAAVFDILGHDLSGISFLELFAGSGAIGLEAISRGAEEVIMVEHNDLAAKTIRENAESLGIELGGKFSLVHDDAFTLIKRLAQEGRRFDIVFLDPPYAQKARLPLNGQYKGKAEIPRLIKNQNTFSSGGQLAKKALKLIPSRDILHAQSLVLVQAEASERLEIPQELKVLTQRRYGSSYLTLLQKVIIE